MPPFPEEIDLFSAPHIRMKELVNTYLHKIYDVDFANCNETFLLLKELQNILYEFKSHESIENMFIMDQLKNRLKQRHIYNSAVCNCHKDNKLSKILDLVLTAKYLKECSPSQRITFGECLQRYFSEFVKDFLPHMEEEENIFQPLMVEHFEYEELKVLKDAVLEQHELIRDPLHQEKSEFDSPEFDTAIKELKDLDLPAPIFYDDCEELKNGEVLKDFVETVDDLDENFEEVKIRLKNNKTELLNGKKDDLHSVFCDEALENHEEKLNYRLCEEETYQNYKFCQQIDINDPTDYLSCTNSTHQKFESEEIQNKELLLPSEVMVHIFEFLSPVDRGKCAQVCSRWNDIVYSTPLWKSIYPVQWFHGIWSWSNTNLHYTLEDEISSNNEKCQQKCDEDADVDESEEENFTQQAKVTEFFNEIVAHLLPRIGKSVEKLVLDAGTGLTSRQIRQFIILCPNLIHFSAAYTTFDSYSLKGLRRYDCLKNLQHLDVQGCTSFTDQTLFLLSQVLSNAEKILISYETMISLQRQNSQCPYLVNGTFCSLINAPCPLVSKCGSKGESEEFSQCFLNWNNFDSFEDVDDLERSGSVSGPEVKTKKSYLKHLNMSGCFEVTEMGLRYLLNAGLLQKLSYLNVSSCFDISGIALSEIVENCQLLQAENLSYCDAILNGPYQSTAGGCDNIGHPAKICCQDRK